MPPENSREDFALVVTELTQGEGEQNANEGREVAVSAPEPSPPADKGRDDSGRFVARTEPDTQQVPADKQPKPKTTAVTTPAPKPGALVAPQSWKPEEREYFKTAKPEVQAVVVRREREMEQMMRTTAEARQFKGEFDEMIRPYKAMIDSENSTPLQATNHLLKMAYLMRVGTPQQKCGIVADLICDFGLDPATLDAVLTNTLRLRAGQPVQQIPGMAPAVADNGILGLVRQELAPIMQWMRQQQGAMQVSDQELTNRAAAEMDTFFNDPANEFANDVRTEIGVLLGSYAEANLPLSLSEAYQMATMRHPEISKLIASRKQGATGAQLTAAARRAQEAAASVSSNGGAPTQTGEDEGDGSLRSDIASAWRSVASRR